MAQQDIEEAKRRAEFEKLLTSARVGRMRGDYARAAADVKAALAILPADLDARELAADILLALGKTAQAADEFKSIFQEDPSRASAEEKFARATVEMAEAKRQRELLENMTEAPTRVAVGKRNPLVAAAISIAPGFGQVYCGQLVRGIVLFCVVMICWLLFRAFTPDVSYLPREERLGAFIRSFSSGAVIFACAGLFVHIYAIIDAAAAANKTGSS